MPRDRLERVHRSLSSSRRVERRLPDGATLRASAVSRVGVGQQRQRKNGESSLEDLTSKRLHLLSIVEKKVQDVTVVVGCQMSGGAQPSTRHFQACSRNLSDRYIQSETDQAIKRWRHRWQLHQPFIPLFLRLPPPSL